MAVGAQEQQAAKIQAAKKLLADEAARKAEKVILVDQSYLKSELY